MTVHASFKAEVKRVATEGDKGEVTALVSVFDNVDKQGDRVVKGAFTTSLLEWAASGDPIPVVWSHKWDDPHSHIGVVKDAYESDRGLVVNYALDIEDNPAAAQAWRLIKQKRVKEHSFGYEVVRERRGKDGANELVELRLIEVGPTLKGANPATEVLATKSYDPMDETRALERRIAAMMSGDVKSSPRPLPTDAELRAQVKTAVIGAGMEWTEPAPPAPRTSFEPNGFEMSPGVPIGGMQLCSAPGCSTIIPAGVEFCSGDHGRGPRAYITALSSQYVDLDELLRDAEAEHAAAQKVLDETAENLAEVRRRIAVYDGNGAA